MKTFITILVGLGILIFALSFMSSNKNSTSTLELGDALVLVGDQLPFVCLAEGDPDAYTTCTVSVSTENDLSIIDVVYDGLFDDSVRAIKISTLVTSTEDGWVVGETTESYRCHVGRGQQDFGTDFCA